MLMSVNPHADAERHANEQEAADELQQEAERQAPLIILAALQKITKPGDWFNSNLLSAGRGWAPRRGAARRRGHGRRHAQRLC